ncbi:C6 finger domain protein, putative [Cordyceps militaris CM01]|uniref:C6 finger domain protein, putative n=1 Tax=Cordyceps militaris (strain CM01) TaxID=983644 RepID=G3J6Y1_CORMM|nr:C6 finger domain protein, putative [Cordyceps militaris CM01]EGX96258.1 C6 finger domain protein, putative [Cordyceps militaris CM01]
MSLCVSGPVYNTQRWIQLPVRANGFVCPRGLVPPRNSQPRYRSRTPRLICINPPILSYHPLLLPDIRPTSPGTPRSLQVILPPQGMAFCTILTSTSQPQQPPPHSPAQPQYPSYSSRDSLTKREGPEDGRRPTSGSHGLDGVHGSASHHSAPPPLPHSYPSEPQRHVNYDSTQLPPTPSYRHNTGSSSMQPPQPYESQSQSAYASAGEQSMYGGMYTSSSVAPAKKKNTRASQACDSCRQLKAKCDELRPCKTCRDRGTECKYRDPPPKVADKTQSDILEGIALLQNQLSSLTADLSTLTGHFANMNERMTRMEACVMPKTDLIDPTPNMNSVVEDECKPERTPLNGNEMVNYSSQDNGAAGTDQTMLPEDELETEPGPPPPVGEPAIPINHTTLAGLLLDWPSIQEMTKHHTEREGITYVGEYPISQEQNRGLLIVYGRGEDNRMSRKQREREHDQQSVDMPDDSSDSPSPSIVTEAADWGTMGGLGPYDQIDYRSGVLGPDGNPDFSEAKVWSYVESFKENILNMHPIVQPPILDQWVRQFLDSFPIQGNKHIGKTSTAWAVSSSFETTGLKRKRSSPGPPDNTESSSAASPTARTGRPNRTIHTALVLTILALGKVCQHRDYVPDALHVGDPMPHGRFQINGIPQSPKGSPPSDTPRSQSSNLASPHEQERPNHGRRSSLSGNPRASLLKKNYENIPGLEYFAFATDILGNHYGSYNNMKNVYAQIFAGLYQGQLGRPLESFAFIQGAGHKLQVIMRPSLEKLKRCKTERKFINDHKYNQLSLAFWTCLQLESDLLAELPCPPSGLLSYENDIPHPNMSLLEGFAQPVLDSYLGQLYLRTHLNCIHRMFYGPGDPTKNGILDMPYKNVDFVSAAVSGMEWVAKSLVFREEDPPATDILAARLRAKYWGAQVLTYRPFLRQMLQFSFAKNHPTIGQPPSSEFRAEVEAPRIDPQARSVEDLDPHILVLSQKAIKALIESTRAFHGLGDKRPIITSVFGTAHAQWGNLLVLSAAFRDPIMGAYVDEKLLRHLFQKTIAFLRQSATATSSLRIDMHILEGIQHDFWGIEPSYSSNYNGASHPAGSAQTTTARMSSDSIDMPPPRNAIEGEATSQLHNYRSTPAAG